MKILKQALRAALAFACVSLPAMEKPKPKICIDGPHAIAHSEKVLYAFVDGVAVGKILFIINPYLKTARIQLLKVDASSRGCGVGYQLFKACFDYIKKRGCTVLNWTIYPIDSVELDDLVAIYLKIIKKIRCPEGLEVTMKEARSDFGNACVSMQIKIRKS